MSHRNPDPHFDPHALSPLDPRATGGLGDSADDTRSSRRGRFAAAALVLVAALVAGAFALGLDTPLSPAPDGPSQTAGTADPDDIASDPETDDDTTTFTCDDCPPENTTGTETPETPGEPRVADDFGYGPGRPVTLSDKARRNEARRANGLPIIGPDSPVASGTQSDDRGDLLDGNDGDNAPLRNPTGPQRSVDIRSVSYKIDSGANTFTATVRLADLRRPTTTPEGRTVQMLNLDIGRETTNVFSLAFSSATPDKSLLAGSQSFATAQCTDSLARAKPRADFERDKVSFTVSLQCIPRSEPSSLSVDSTLWFEPKARLGYDRELANDSAGPARFFLSRERY